MIPGEGAPLTIEARYVISNASARQTFLQLLGGEFVSSVISRQAEQA